jgi:hypothetical protein
MRTHILGPGHISTCCHVGAGIAYKKKNAYTHTQVCGLVCTCESCWYCHQHVCNARSISNVRSITNKTRRCGKVHMCAVRVHQKGQQGATRGRSSVKKKKEKCVQSGSIKKGSRGNRGKMHFWKMPRTFVCFAPKKSKKKSKKSKKMCIEACTADAGVV